VPAPHSAEFCLVREENGNALPGDRARRSVLVHGNRLGGAKRLQPVPLLIALWKSDLVGSDIDPLHGVFGERAANRGWGPWFLRNLVLCRPRTTGGAVQCGLEDRASAASASSTKRRMISATLDCQRQPR